MTQRVGGLAQLDTKNTLSARSPYPADANDHASIEDGDLLFVRSTLELGLDFCACVVPVARTVTLRTAAKLPLLIRTRGNLLLD